MKDTDKFLYHLEDPHMGDSKIKKVCPACGKKSFKYYVGHDHLPLDPTCGRCDHENSCAYHKTPKMLFEEMPYLKERRSHDNYIARTYTPPPPPPIAYLDLTVLDNFNQERTSNNFFRFIDKTFGEQAAKDVFDRYQVGTSRRWRYENGFTTVFPQIDQQGRLHQLKMMAYNPHNGKRLKEDIVAEVWSESKGRYYKTSQSSPFIYFAGRDYLDNKNATLQQCFFGGHLIEDSKPVGVVESEKSAMICSIMLPDYTWIATGGCNGCRWYDPVVFKPLVGKKVVLFPDSGMEQKWEEKAKVLRKQGVNVEVSKYCKDSEPNSDLVDILFEKMEKQGENPSRRVPKGDNGS